MHLALGLTTPNAMEKDLVKLDMSAQSVRQSAVQQS